MDIAIVSGAASGLGLAISRKLIELGFKVYGLGGNYSSTSYSHPSFIPTAVNLADLDAVEEKVKGILDKEGNIYALVNNAKIYPSKTLDETSFSDIETVLKINLHLPILLAKLALPGLKKYQGHIINIGSSTPELSRGGPIGAASSGGLNFFGQSFFEAYRQTGVKLTSIFPQANRWRPDEVPAPAAENPQSIIDAEAVAEAVKSVVDNKSGNIITELVIRPEKIVEEVTPSVLYVPYPKPKPIPAIGLRSGSPAKSGGTSDKKNHKNDRRKERPQKEAKKDLVEETESASEVEGQNAEEATMSRSARRRQRQRERRENYRQRKAEEEAASKDTAELLDSEDSDSEVKESTEEQKPRRGNRQRDPRRKERFNKDHEDQAVAEEKDETSEAKEEVEAKEERPRRRENRQRNDRRRSAREDRSADKDQESPYSSDKAEASKEQKPEEKAPKKEVKAVEKKQSPREALPTAGFDFVPGELDASDAGSKKSLFSKAKPSGGRSRSRRNRGRTAFDHMKAGSASADSSGPGLLPDVEKTEVKKEKVESKELAPKKANKKAPAKKAPAAKKSAPSKKAVVKKATAAKKATKKTASKKVVTKKVATKKAAPAKKVAAKKAVPAKKAAVKKTTATKKTATKKAATKKVATKKATKKTATKKK